MAEIVLKPIGIIRSPNTDPSKTHIEPAFAEADYFVLVEKTK
jgi:tRNA (Thr-GGU) A37 N-methylase